MLKQQSGLIGMLILIDAHQNLDAWLRSGSMAYCSMNMAFELIIQCSNEHEVLTDFIYVVIKQSHRLQYLCFFL